MIADAIHLVLTNVPVLLFVLALVFASLSRSGAPAEHYLSWILLLSVGFQGIWAGTTHVFLPQTAAAFIGWQPSPFQYEIGIADLALGIVAVVSFWQSRDFKAAVVLITCLTYVGLAIGHVRQVLTTGDHAPGNFGMLLILTVLVPVVMIALWWQGRSTAAPRRP
ncbi:DUF6790 family protein [Xanthobacter sp. V3C-3]|uniref:DUF6790 family protein n=1 Tax=Xanthobacter lutulentifluminis TaxID=3119935 RepID=UPI00372A3829